jgi:hypothetical protein
MQLSVKHPSVSFFSGISVCFCSKCFCVYLIEVIASNGRDDEKKIKIYELNAINSHFFPDEFNFIDTMVVVPLSLSQSLGEIFIETILLTHFIPIQ